METTAVTLELAISSKTGVKYLPEQKISSANIQMYKLLDEVVKGIEGYTIIPERRQAVGGKRLQPFLLAIWGSGGRRFKSSHPDFELEIK